MSSSLRVILWVVHPTAMQTAAAMALTGASGVLSDEIQLVSGALGILLCELDECRGTAGREGDLILGEFLDGLERLGPRRRLVGRVDQHLKLSVIRPARFDLRGRDS